MCTPQQEQLPPCCFYLVDPEPRSVLFLHSYYIQNDRLTSSFSPEHIHWIDETLIRALHSAPRSLSISVRIYVTAARRNIQVMQRTYGQNDNAEAVHGDSSSECEGIEKRKDSLLAIEAVQLEHARCDLQSVLRDEVEMATGRMSVSGLSYSLHCLQMTVILIISCTSVWLADDSSICSWCPSVPGV